MRVRVRVGVRVRVRVRVSVGVRGASGTAAETCGDQKLVTSILNFCGQG